MRATFVETLTELAGSHPEIALLTGDLGFMALEPFAERFPERFFNVGVAEQNMIGLATGLAEAGFVPFAYSIATFASLRGYEFIRNGPVAHGLPVRIVGVGGGFEYGSAGLTHHALEDVGVLRLQPGLTVLAPADYRQTRSALLATWNAPGPVYFRIGKDDRTQVEGLEGRFEPGKNDLVRLGTDVLLVAMGAIASDAVQAAKRLEASGVSTAVSVVSTLSPAPAGELEELLSGYDTVLTVESHYACGGLGSLLAETIAESGLRCRLVRCAVRELTDGRSGSTSYYRRRHGLSPEAIASAASQALGVSSA